MDDPEESAFSPMSNSLYRNEVLGDANALQGPILLSRPPGFGALTVLGAAIVVALLAFFVGFSTTSTSRLPGTVAPVAGTIRIVADRSGRALSRRVIEGQSVRLGDPLFDVQGQGGDLMVSRLIAQRRDSLLAEAGHRLTQHEQRRAAFQHRLSHADRERRRTEQELVLSRRKVDIDEAALERQRPLLASGMIPVAVLHQAESALIEARQRLSQQHRAVDTALRDQAELGQALRDAEIQHRRDEEAASRALASVEQELALNDAGREAPILAPAAGRISAVRVEAGQAVVAGEVLAYLWPEGAELEADLRASSRAVAFLKPGSAVRLQLDAFPHQHFGGIDGHVREIELVATEPALSDAGPTYRVRVRLQRQSLAAHGIDHPLRPGMSLEAIVPLERRRLYEWVLDPLKRLMPRAPATDAS